MEIKKSIWAHFKCRRRYGTDSKPRCGFNYTKPCVTHASREFVTLYRHLSLIQSVLLQTWNRKWFNNSSNRIRPVWHYDTTGKNKPGKCPMTPAPNIPTEITTLFLKELKYDGGGGPRFKELQTPASESDRDPLQAQPRGPAKWHSRAGKEPVAWVLWHSDRFSRMWRRTGEVRTGSSCGNRDNTRWEESLPSWSLDEPHSTCLFCKQARIENGHVHS